MTRNDETDPDYRAAAALNEIIRATENGRPIPPQSLNNLQDATEETTAAQEWRQILRDS
ncbi:hypothetical protein ACH4UR_37630 [Streptomyces lydicus]|uniref:hypothetical protein n=1 Tax=Streptomyces lydicus TaxID=47763 RepID=UPI00340F5271